jgi:hypothetical protein
MPLAKSTFVVFGIDENGKTKGARFSGKKLELALHAATTLELEVFEAVSAEMQKLAKELPSGNIYVRGRAFLPFIKRELYQKLHVASGGLVRDRADEIAETCQTTMVDSESKTKSSDIPKNWASIAPGHLVLTTEGEGWWESIVLKRDGEILTLRYRDFPTFPNFDRHVATVALINPNFQ